MIKKIPKKINPDIQYIIIFRVKQKKKKREDNNFKEREKIIDFKRKNKSCWRGYFFILKL